MAIRCELGGLFLQGQTRAFAVTEGIGLEHQINPLSCIFEIEMQCPAMSSCTKGSPVELSVATTGHIKFINDDVFIYVRIFRSTRSTPRGSPARTSSGSGGGGA